MESRDKLDDLSDQLEEAVQENDVKFMLCCYTGLTEDDQGDTLSKTVVLSLYPKGLDLEPELETHVAFTTYKHMYIRIKQAVEKMDKAIQDRFWKEVSEQVNTKEKDNDFKGVIH